MSWTRSPSSRSHYSSRSSYPSFLSLHSTVKLHLTWAFSGFLDAFRWDLVATTITRDPEIRGNALKSLLLNSLSLTSIYMFDLLLQPLLSDQQKWLHRNVGWFYQILWLFPVVGVSFYLNSSWCTIIAKRTYTLQHGMGSHSVAHHQSISYTGLLTTLATSAYRIVMVFTSVVLDLALRAIPFVGSLASFVFLCWVDSYYCFEFVWIARGFPFSRRVRHLEERWAYYFGFGLPAAALCTWGSSLANAALFALIFPSYIIMAMHSHPTPTDPYKPFPPDSQEAVQHPSPFIPIRLPVFAAVIWLNDSIIRLLTIGRGQPMGRVTKRHGHSFSDTGFSCVEEGESVELRAVGAPKSSVKSEFRVIGKGAGRKMD